MKPQIFDCVQGSEEWFAVRMGIPTASEFATVMASGRGGGESKTRATYMRKLAGELLTGEIAENYTNMHLERGKAMEAEARAMYALEFNEEPTLIGFVKNSQAGCSPDSFIGSAGGLEIKTALPHIQIERLEKNELPPEYRAQVQGTLWVCDRAWWDFVSYWPKLPLLRQRVYRDNGYIATIAGAVTKFNDELAALVERIKHYGETP